MKYLLIISLLFSSFSYGQFPPKDETGKPRGVQIWKTRQQAYENWSGLDTIRVIDSDGFGYFTQAKIRYNLNTLTVELPVSLDSTYRISPTVQYENGILRIEFFQKNSVGIFFGGDNGTMKLRPSPNAIVESINLLSNLPNLGCVCNKKIDKSKYSCGFFAYSCDHSPVIFDSTTEVGNRLTIHYPTQQK